MHLWLKWWFGEGAMNNFNQLRTPGPQSGRMQLINKVCFVH